VNYDDKPPKYPIRKRIEWYFTWLETFMPPKGSDVMLHIIEGSPSKLGYHGETSKKANTFYLSLILGRCRSCTIDSLMHEWAHILTWDANEKPHGPKWCKAYVKVYNNLPTIEGKPCD
jgi:hypothetical protein